MGQDGDAALGPERLLNRWKRWRVSVKALPPLLQWTLRLALSLGPLVLVFFTWVAVADGFWEALRVDR